MTERPWLPAGICGFLEQPGDDTKNLDELFTPQIGETSYEIIPRHVRPLIVQELQELRKSYPKLAMPESVINAYLDPPANPRECTFARTTKTVTADLKSLVTPCQFGGTPDCTQCGCIASAGLAAVDRLRIPWVGIPVGSIYKASLAVGAVMAQMRGD
jgi:hypothetical protein